MNRLLRKNSLRCECDRLMMFCLLVTCALLDVPVFAVDKNEYLPPIAPQIDRSSVERGASNDGAPSASVKDLLLQALNRHNAGDSAGAERLFRKVLAIDPNNPDANFNLGTLAEQNHDWSGALGYYSAAAKANPSDPDIKAALAEVKDKMQKTPQGSQAAEAIEKRNRLRAIGQEAAAAYKAGKYDEAIKELQSIQREQPDDACTQFALGQAYRAKGDKMSAMQHFSKAASLDPQNKLFANALHDVGQPSGIRWTPDAQPSSNSALGSAGGERTANNQHARPHSNPSGWVEDDDETATNQRGSSVGWQSVGSGSQLSGQGAGLQPFTDQGQGQLEGITAPNGLSARAAGLGFGSVYMGSGIMGGGIMNGGIMNGGMMNGGMINGGMMGMPMGTQYGYSMPVYGYRTASPYGYPSFVSPYGYTAPAYGYGGGLRGGIRRF